MTIIANPNKTMTGKYLTGAGLAAQDQQILDVYLENESIFKNKLVFESGIDNDK